MNTTKKILLKSLRRLYIKITRNSERISEKKIYIKSSENLIYDRLLADEPCMIARFGSTELTCLINYVGVKSGSKNYIKFIRGEENKWWWDYNIIDQMYEWSGFFPPTLNNIERFCEMMIDDMQEVDILGSWLDGENYFDGYLNCYKTHLRNLEPFWLDLPWTKALENKRVLVIHPFSETILAQYEKRKNIFENSNILPEFKSLDVIKAVQTLGQTSSEYDDWFDALNGMKKQIDKTDFDICLIGAGAYGFPLAAHVKRIGKKAIHLGGALQLIFGIRGKRWEDANYGVKEWGISNGEYSELMNKYWVRPLDKEKPKTAGNVEDSCYW
ncbi:hypothetical protein SAMN04487907_101135 [Zunongwangia mangrovi]|uniref:Uncharacterized protein n=1 Tax=Zunongwangia mangrovi TaxID=1334022 RepID=A0A1I1D9X6_9FLAO|nr:hypothetical protein [Zunongwangia mangrovi]SFB69888.1 hypothetical protein SAMN04487907_101135 [Zunongwangia mangrovi]